MANFETLAVLVDTAGTAASVVSYANLFARLGGAREVRFVQAEEDGAASVAEIREQMREHIKTHFDADASTSFDVLHGHLPDRLLAFADELQADMIVLSGKSRVLAARVAMMGHCSVAVIPENAPARLSHLAVALDFSCNATSTLRWTTGLIASDPAIRCTALHVLTHESTDLFADAETDAAQAEVMTRILANADCHGVPVASRLVNAARHSDIGDRHRIFPAVAIQGADVAAAILAEAANCNADCIALSTRGRSSAAAILLGSVTEKVIEHARVPLLIHKHSGKNLGLAAILLGRTGQRVPSLKAS